MGSLITVDSWLLDLARRGKEYAATAQAIAAIQYHVSKSQGHIMAVSDPFVRRKLVEAGRWGNLPRINIRCLRCDCVASLLDWRKCATYTRDDRFTAIADLSRRKGELVAAFLKDCPGETWGEAIWLTLRDNMKESAT